MEDVESRVAVEPGSLFGLLFWSWDVAEMQDRQANDSARVITND